MTVQGHCTSTQTRYCTIPCFLVCLPCSLLLGGQQLKASSHCHYRFVIVNNTFMVQAEKHAKISPPKRNEVCTCMAMYVKPCSACQNITENSMRLVAEHLCGSRTVPKCILCSHAGLFFTMVAGIQCCLAYAQGYWSYAKSP